MPTYNSCSLTAGGPGVHDSITRRPAIYLDFGALVPITSHYFIYTVFITEIID